MFNKLTPFNVRLLQLTDLNVRNMRAITVQDPFDGATKNFHPEGLFSNEIFGQTGDKKRMRTFAYIDVKVPIMHPLVHRILGKLKRIYPEIMAGRTYARFDEVEKDFVKSDPVNGDTGYHFFVEHFDKVVFPKRLSDNRELSIKFIERVRKIMFNTKVIVLPAGLRDYVIMGDTEEQDEVNKLYRKLMGNANTVTPQMFEISPKTYDRVRSSMQAAFNAIYEYYEGIIFGKNKLIQGHVMTSQVIDGTRSVFTAQNIEVKELFGEGTPDTNTTGVGLYQFIKGARPKCVYAIQNGFLKTIFTSPGAPIRLVDSKTLQSELIQAPMEFYDAWMTKEGIEKIFNLFGEIDRRHDYLRLGDYYLCLTYNDGKVFKLFSDIRDLPEGFDKKYVTPTTFAEFLYSQVYHLEKQVTANTTRFPITGFGSIYPSNLFMIPTAQTIKLQPLDDNWQVSKDLLVMRDFPVKDQPFNDTIMPSSDKLKGMTADCQKTSPLAS